MKYYKISLLITVLFLHFDASAQKKWSLQMCIDHAFENNIVIKQQKLNILLSENTYKQSKYAALPNLNAGSEYNINLGRTVDKYTNTFSDNNVKSANFYISSSVTLFGGFQNYNSIKKNKFSLLARLQDFEKIKNDISLNIAAAYLQILFNKEIVKISEKQLELSKIQEKRIGILVKAGKLTESNLLDLQAQSANDELKLIVSKSELEKSVLNLKQFLDIKNDTVFDIEVPDVGNITNISAIYSIGEVYEKAQKLPQIRAAEYDILAGKKELSIAKGGVSPKLSLVATYATGFSDARKQYSPGDTLIIPSGYVADTYQTVYSYAPSYTEGDYPFGNQLTDNANTSIGFRLTVPIFNNRQVATNINNAKIKLLNYKYNLQNQQNQLYKDIQLAYFDVQTAVLKFKSSEKAVEANEKAFKNSEKRFTLGLLNSTDYNISKNKYIQAKSELIKAKYEFLFKKSVMDFYSGNKISIKD